MVLEEVAFGIERDADLLVCLNVSLSSVHDRNVSQSERNNPSGKNVNNVRSRIPISKSVSLARESGMGTDRVHKINLGQDTNRPRPLRVDFPRQLEPI